MSLTNLLLGIGLAWIVLGCLVLGPALLIYPCAWAIIAAFFYGLHKNVGSKIEAPNFQATESTTTESVPAAKLSTAK